MVVAFCLIGCGVLFIRNTRHALEQKLRAELQTMAARGEISQAEADAGDVSDMGMELPESELFRINMADILMGFSFVWVPLVIALCLGVAVWTKPHESAIVKNPPSSNPG